MDIRIFTLPFDPVLEGFPDDQIAEFCLNKRVHRLDAQFFVQEGRAYWSVAIHCDPSGLTVRTARKKEFTGQKDK